jgi:hypothetical protein
VLKAEMLKSGNIEKRVKSAGLRRDLRAWDFERFSFAAFSLFFA